MCGIIGMVGTVQVAPFLIEGLKRLEYRGYDSAGLAVLSSGRVLSGLRVQGKVSVLSDLLAQEPQEGHVGIAHTRWATHGAPSERNAHPFTAQERVAVVHNGIIENHEALRSELAERGVIFHSDTDTEVAVHLFYEFLSEGCSLEGAARLLRQRLKGSYALVFVDREHPDVLIGIRMGCPLVVGLSDDCAFFASDTLALTPWTRRVIYLQDGDLAILSREHLHIEDELGQSIGRDITVLTESHGSSEKGEHPHYMLKEMLEQPEAIEQLLEGRLLGHRVPSEIFGAHAASIFSRVARVHIIGCGSSYHAAMVARYWIEHYAGLPCQVDIASEDRYRNPHIEADTLLVAISQSGETADLLAAVRARKEKMLAILGLCNVPESALMRLSDLTLLLRAGPEIGVASTKAFSAQLMGLMLLTQVLAAERGCLHDDLSEEIHAIPRWIHHVMQLRSLFTRWAEDIASCAHMLFLGRGVMFPIALEGALKMKELSYIHAEAYPSGELKHGPLALIDANMPVFALAPSDALYEKTRSNLYEVSARAGRLYLLVDDDDKDWSALSKHIIRMPKLKHLAPILYTVPLQFLAYETALLRGHDVDQPRHLAKSVTVE